jgi:hypothetical protein
MLGQETFEIKVLVIQADEALGAREYPHQVYVLSQTSDETPFLYRPGVYDIEFPSTLSFASGMIQVPHAIVK